MVVNESINVEKVICIEGGVHYDRLVDKKSSPCSRHEVSSTNNTINMDDCNVRGPAVANIWLDHPTACILVVLGTHKGIPLNECTLILLAVMRKGEEQEDSSYLESAGTIGIRFGVDKDTIMAWRAISPRWCCSNVFAMHARDTTDIAWGVKCCDS